MELCNTVELKEFECQFCNKMFGNKQNLLQHQKKTKYCLRLHRNEDFNVEMMIKEYKKQEEYKEKQKIKCPFCYSIFANIILLDQHQKRAKHCLKIQEAQAKAKEVETIKLQETTKELTCQFCSKQFKTKCILVIHQTQAKYCLKIQESQNYKKIVASLVVCKYCKSNFSIASFNRHDAICKKKIQFLLNEKDQEIAKMKDEKVEIYKNAAQRAQATIEEIAKKPTHQKTTTKNIQNNIVANLTSLDLSQDRVAFAIAEKYTKSDFYQGQKGVAQVVHKHLLTDTTGKSQIVCTDAKQGAFHHKALDGEQVVDYENAHLIKSVHDPIKKKAGEIAAVEIIKHPMLMAEITKNSTSITELDSKPGVFNRRMAQLTGKNCAKVISTPTQEIFPITQEWLSENVKFFSIEHIVKGPEGYADYFISYPLKDRLLVVDYSNAVVRFKDSFGELIDDIGGVVLIKNIFDSLRVRNKELIMEYCTCLNDNFVDNGEEIVQLLDYRVAVEKCADGNYVGDDDGDFRGEFIGFLLGKI